MTGVTAAVQSPTSLLQLFTLMGKGLIKGIPQMLKKSLIKLALIFGVILFINTYLLVVKNEGFAPMLGNRWLDITSLEGNIAWATTFWTFAMFFFTTVIARIREDGFGKFMKDVTSAPVFFAEQKKASGKGGTIVLLLSFAAILLLTLPFPMKRPFLLYSVMAFLSFTKRGQSFLMIFFTLFVSDMRKLLSIKKKFSQSALYLMVFSVWVAFLTAYLIKGRLLIIAIALVCGGLGIFLMTKNKGIKTAVLLMIGLALNMLIYRSTGILLADDGGWQEAGGTLQGWLQSAGAATAVMMGVPPAIGSLAGAGLGWIYSNYDLSDFMPDTSVYSDIFDDYVDDLYQDGQELYEEGVEFVGDVSSDIYETVTETGDYLSDTADQVGDYLSDTADQVGDYLSDAATSASDFMSDFFDNVYQDITTGDYKPIDESVVSDDFSYDNVKDYISIFSNAVGYSGDAGKVKDAITLLVDKTSGFKGFMKDMIKNSDEYADAASKLMGNPGAKLQWLKDSFKNFKSNKVTSGMNGLGTFLNVLGAGLDWYDNVQNGDSIIGGGVKSAAGNSLAITLASKAGSTTVAAWELGNTVLFGGSNASKVFSPVTTVKGGVNLIYDYVTGMDQQKIMDRLHDTKNGYGENIKNLVYAADFAEDFVSDPGKFYETVGDMTQAGGEGWEGMHKSVDDLFRLPDDVRANTKNLYSSDALKTVWDNPLDSTRKVATDAAHFATKTAVRVGEGWAYIGEAAGNGSIWVENKVSSGWQSFKSFFK